MLSSKCQVQILLLLNILGCTTGHMNLYMGEKDTLKLLGLKNYQLSYVRNGIINTYALSFCIPIPPDLTKIHFLWENLRESPPDAAMYYKMAYSVSNLEAMGMPTANISKEGVVPTVLTTFAISLPCTGLMDAQVDVGIQMNISIYSASNLTLLDIKRKKICRKIDGSNKPGNPSATGGTYVPGSRVPNSGSGAPNPGSRSMFNTSIWDSRLKKEITGNTNSNSSTNIFYIAVGCACAVILMIAFGVGFYYVQSQKRRRQQDREVFLNSGASSTNQGSVFLRVDKPNNVSTTALSNAGQCHRKSFQPQEISPTDVMVGLKQIHVERNKISLGEVLYEGTFGRIYQGILLGEDENEVNSERTVFIKTVTDQARSDQIQRMLLEGSILMGLCHSNLSPVIASCLDNESQPLLVFPYSNEGLLKKFLLKCKVSDLGAHQGLNTQQLVYMAIQAIKGLQHLHRKRIVHKDVASRNFVIDSQFTVKVIDGALARDLFPNDYHCLGDNENRPVKWLALEALLEKRFSPASDVWSFGVLLWELMTLGSQPYSEIDPFEMEAYLREGYRIMQPSNCPDELFAVMACCWALSVDERPKFSQLLVCLQDFYTALGRYV